MSSPAPRCCAGAAQFISLHYSYEELADHETADAYMAKVTSLPPKWSIAAATADDYPRTFYVAVKFCPFCGASLPPVALRSKLPMHVRVFIDGGHYCYTCERRLDDCRCAAPERLWRIDTRTPPAPATRKHV